ncbi:MAG: J domain-containing protein [Rhizomicrobium sp.]|jgi:DnaJ-class molecular chaperone
MRNPYDVLGVAKTASEAEIKKAFRALAKKHHPDTHSGDAGAKKRFQEISAAYDIVGDKEKRGKFDRGEIDESGNPRGFDPRAQGFEGHPFAGGAAGGGRGGARNFKFTWPEQEGETAEGFGAEDIFSDLLGGLGGGRRRAAQPRKGDDYSVNMTISFDEAVAGGTRRVTLADGREVDVRIPVGVKDGQQIRLKGQGGPGRQGAPAGDMLLSISVASHPWLVRDGNDLRMDLPVTLKEAVMGGKVTVTTLTGPVVLNVPANSNTGSILRLKGKGVPAHGSGSGGEPAGDLYARLVVTLPDKPDSDLKEFAGQWKAEYDPRAKLH